MKKLVTSAFLILNSLGAIINAQTTTWALPFKPNSTANNVNVTDVEFDASGNVYATGSFRGIVNFNFNGTATNATSAGGHDVFLAKYNSAGTLQWLKTIGGTADDASVALDIRGTSIVIAGTFVSTNVDFDPGTGTNVLSSSGLTDVFVAKFDNTGNHVWAKRSGGTQGELATDVGFDSNLNVFIAGSFTTINDFFSNTNTINTGGARDAFLCKLDANGTYVNVKVIGGAGTDVSNKLTVMVNNWCLICVDIGYSASSSTFDPGSGTSSVTFSGTSGTNGIVVGWNDLGAFLSSMHHFKGNSHMVKMLAQNNENIGIGTFSGTMDIDPTTGVTNVTAVGASDMFMVQTGFATGGSFIAYGIANGTFNGDAIYPTNAVMKVNPTSYQTDLYITGYARGSVNFGGTSTADLVGSTLGDYSFEVKYNHDFATNNDFQLLYAYRNASAAGVASGNENSRGNGIALNATTGDVIIGGYYSSATTSPKPVVFEPGSVSVTQTFNTASMGYVQYIAGCTTPTITTTSAARCGTGTVALSASTTNGTISWYTASTGGSALTTGTTYTTPSISTTTTYYVEGTSNGCVTPVRAAVTATVKTIPSTVASANAYSFCSGTNATLNASGATTYSWNTGSTATSFTVAPTTVTIYTLTGTTNGCSKTDTVKITPKVSPTTIATANIYSICSGSSAVLFGSGATTYSWNNGPTATTQTVTPTATTIYTLTGTSNGCSKTDTVKITIKTATVTSTNPDFRCGPGTVVLAATAAAGTLQWYSAPSGGSPLATGTSYTTPTISGTTTYYVGVNNNGCISALRSAVTATVKTVPTIPTSSNNFSRCGTGTLTISASPGSLGTVFWYSSPTSQSAISSNASYVTPSISSTTTYYAATASGGCYSTRLPVDAVIYNSAPTVAPTNTTPGANLTICSGNTATLSATVGSNETVKWYSVPSGGSALATATVYTTPSLNANTTYYAERNNVCGAGPRTAITVTVGANAVPPTNTTAQTTICSGTTASLSATASGTIKWYTALTGGTLLATNSTYATPVLTANTTYYAENNSTCGTSTRTAITITVTALPNVTASALNNSVCEGASTTLTGSGANTYSWNNGAITPTTSVSPATTTTYTVTGTSTAGCVKSATVLVTVNQVPTITASASNNNICIGANTTLTASGANTYVWNTGSTASTLTVNPTVSTTYTVTGTTTGCSDIAIINVNVNQPPVVTASALDNSICNGANTTLTANGANTYVWNTGSTAPTLTVNPTANTTYTVTGTDASGCVNNAIVTVNVNQLPNNSVTLSGPVLTADETGATYEWVDCGNNQSIPGATNQSYTALANGQYKVIVTNGNGCSNTSSCVNVTATGIENYESFVTNVYPNPFTDELIINTPSNMISEKSTLRVYSIQGHLINSIIVSDEKTVIPSTTWESGIYILEFSVGNKTQRKKVVKL